MKITDQIDSYLTKDKMVNEASQDDIMKKIIDRFSDPAKIKDHRDVHKIAEDLKVEPPMVEEAIYGLLQSFFAYGRSKNFKGSYDPKQLEMGIRVEMEHTNSEIFAERIAKDHLAEPGMSDYYTRLKEMEDSSKG
jgi:hypothetical protein